MVASRWQCRDVRLLLYGNMQHFILTRFNIFLWNRDKKGNTVRDSDWQEHRFTLFERYCLPSIIHQTCQNFEWIVLFDEKTPIDYKRKISEYQNVCPQLIPVFIGSNKGYYFATIFIKKYNNCYITLSLYIYLTISTVLCIW